MRWPWQRRRPEITLTQIEEYVRREVDRQLEQELAAETVVSFDFSATPRQSKTRIFEMIQRVVRNNLADYVRLCMFCQQPFLVPRRNLELADLYAARPADERCCEKHRETKTLKKTSKPRRKPL